MLLDLSRFSCADIFVVVVVDVDVDVAVDVDVDVVVVVLSKVHYTKRYPTSYSLV